MKWAWHIFPGPENLGTFFMASWVEVPSRIELILHSLIQLNMPDFPIINDKTSLLRLVYYNPDYMLQTNDDEYPSIFDLY